MLAAPRPRGISGPLSLPHLELEGRGAAGKVHPHTAVCAVGRRADGPSLPACHSWFSPLGPPPFHFLP